MVGSESPRRRNRSGRGRRDRRLGAQAEAPV